MMVKLFPLNPKLSRRCFLASLSIAAITLAKPSWAVASRQVITILTNHNDDTFSLFEQAFEKSQSKYALKIIWMMPPDAMKLLRRKEDIVDVWWQAAPHNHLVDIGKDGLLQPLAIETDGLPNAIGAQALVAEDDTFRATQLTAFNFEVNAKAIAAQGLPFPSDWNVLAQAAYAGKIALADPEKVRFGSLVLDVAIQSFGWEAGWALLSAIAGNAVLIPHGVVDEVQSGRLPVALHIDIVPNAEQRLRSPIERVYPEHGGIINVGYIGILKNTKNIEGARVFVNFVLSATGQSLLSRTELPRLPVRPSVYSELGKEQFNPFVAQGKGKFTYHTSSNFGNGAVLTAIFEAMVKDHANLSKLWARIHAAEKQGNNSKVAEARKALERVPVNAKQAASEEIRAAFKPTQDRGPNDPPRPNQGLDFSQPPNAPAVKSEAALKLEAQWAEDFHKQQSEAERLLSEAGV
jgi:ABC-type Fe3+ transport system substrate-binding protein